jgi:glucose-1-phosphate thymidylyltransferase
VIVGLVPAAGLAARLQPIACSKEVLPVGGRPVIDFLLERMRVGGAEEIRVVTRPEKEDVARHAERKGAVVVLAEPASVCDSLVAGLVGIAETDVVLLGFPDTIWEPPDGYRPLVAEVERGADVALGLFRGLEPQRSDVVELDDEGHIRGIRVKPRRPRSSLIWGCAAVRAQTLAGMAGYSEPGEYFDGLVGQSAVVGVSLSETFLDIGTPEALERLSLREQPLLEQRFRGVADLHERHS